MFTYRHMCIEINTYHCSRRGSHVPNMYQITNSKVWNVAMPLSYHYGNDPVVYNDPQTYRLLFNLYPNIINIFTGFMVIVVQLSNLGIVMISICASNNYNMFCLICIYKYNIYIYTIHICIPNNYLVCIYQLYCNYL